MNLNNLIDKINIEMKNMKKKKGRITQQNLVPRIALLLH